jgi:hypothetical protein
MIILRAMKIKELKEIIDTYNPELEFNFIVFQQDKGEGGEDIIIKTYAEDWDYFLNQNANQLEIIIDL